MSLKDLIGKVYLNWVTGNEWKIIGVKGNVITLQNRDKSAIFNTTPQLMVNYSYQGEKFKKKLKKVM